MNWLDVEVKRSKVKVTARPNIVKKVLSEFRRSLVQMWQPFRRRHTGQRFVVEDHLVVLLIHRSIPGTDPPLDSWGERSGQILFLNLCLTDWHVRIVFKHRGSQTPGSRQTKSWIAPGQISYPVTTHPVLTSTAVPRTKMARTRLAETVSFGA